MQTTKDLCGILPGYQEKTVSCLINNGNGCFLNNFGTKTLSELQGKTEKAINDCVIYQSEYEKTVGKVK